MQHKQDPIYRELITSKRWRETRMAKLRQQPFCERCLAAGIYTSATEVHHLTPLESVRGREAMSKLAFSMNNLQSLCHACHVQAHKELGRLTKASTAERTEQNVDAFAKKFFG